MREANAVDFWRGFALVSIFVNHVPGNVFEGFTHKNVSISDAAEIFVFLAGWSLALATTNPKGWDSARRVVLRLLSRLVEVYRAQLVTTAIALAMVAGAAVILDNPLFLEWHNAGPVFADPVHATVGWVLMTHQLGYFNILPLYVVLLALAPPFVLLARRHAGLALLASSSLYLYCLVNEISLPTWPTEGTWFFNPFTWQFLLMLGYVAAATLRDRPALQSLAKRLQSIAIAGVLLAAALTWVDWRPDPFSVPEPRLLFLFDKGYLSPARLLHVLLLVLAFQGAFAHIARHAPTLADQFSALGRNSLAVFSVGSILSLAAWLVRFVTGGGMLVDIFVIGIGLACLAFTAWFVEWRTRSPRPSSLSS
ncbi:MAG TPA: OpgC domain-containing protein [Beijerinckiaceae bacterium]|jgi:hypothetical protein